MCTEYFDTLRSKSGEQFERQMAEDLLSSGSLKWKLKMQQEAIEDYERALELKIQCQGDQTYDVALCLHSLGVVYNNTGDTDSSVHCYEAAIAILDSKSISDF